MADPLLTQDAHPQKATARIDHLSAWSMLLLGIVVVIQLISQFNLAGKLTGGLIKSTVEGPKNADIRDVLDIDWEAKLAYATTRLNPKSSVPLLADKSLLHARADAEDQLRQFPSDRDIARRVMLLRAETGAQPLMGVTATRKAAAIPPPLDAFDSTQPTQEAEAVMWRQLLSYKRLPRGSNIDAIAREIYAVPSLRWYRSLALHQLYLRANRKAVAAREMDASVTSAINSMVPLVALYSVVAMIALAGLTLLTGLAVRAFMLRNVEETERITVFDALAIPLPETIAPLDRKLGGGDLFNLFVVCMVLFVGISYAVELIPLDLFPAAFKSLSPGRRVNAVVAMLASSQTLTTVLSIAIVLRYARARGASVAKEIGLTFARPLKSALSGLAGWGMSLPLLFASSKLAMTLFPHTPDPSNPALPLTIHASGIEARVALFIVICVLAPIFEEIMFRGLFYQTARSKIGPWPAIVLSGIVFGLVHPVSIVGSIPLMALGMVLAWLAETRKSLLPGMVAHSLQNTMSFLTMMYLS